MWSFRSVCRACHVVLGRLQGRRLGCSILEFNSQRNVESICDGSGSGNGRCDVSTTGGPRSLGTFPFLVLFPPEQDFSASAVLTFGPNTNLLWVILCLVGCLAASLASTH